MEYPRTFPSFQNFEPREKDLRDNKHNSLNLGRNYARIFVLGHYLFLGAHVFLELRSRKTVRFSEERMSEDKINVLFSRQIEPIVYINVFFYCRSQRTKTQVTYFILNTCIYSYDGMDWIRQNLEKKKYTGY